MRKNKNQSLYESIMLDVAKVVKRRIIEASEQENKDDRMYVDLDKEGKIRLLSEEEVMRLFKGESIGAYDPTVKAGPSEKEWNMYAVKVTDIKGGTCAFLGRNEGWPDYMTSTMTLYGKVSFIKAGNGGQWEYDFPGKIEIDYDPKKRRYSFTPYKCDDKYENMTPRSNFSHFIHRAVYVPFDKEDKEIQGKDKLKWYVQHLARGWRSYNAVRRLIKDGYLEVKDGELVKKEK